MDLLIKYLPDIMDNVNIYYDLEWLWIWNQSESKENRIDDKIRPVAGRFSN